MVLVHFSLTSVNLTGTEGIRTGNIQVEMPQVCRESPEVSEKWHLMVESSLSPLSVNPKRSYNRRGKTNW